MPINATHARMESLLSLYLSLHCVFRHYSCKCVAYCIFYLQCRPCMRWVRHVGNRPLYCRFARPVLWGEGTICWSVRCKLSVWSRVGRSARLLGIVTRPILAVSCSSQHLIMRASSETMCHRRSLCCLSCQRSPFPVSCHQIWNRTQCIIVVVTLERLGHWIVTQPSERSDDTDACTDGTHIWKFFGQMQI